MHVRWSDHEADYVAVYGFGDHWANVQGVTLHCDRLGAEKRGTN